MKKQFWACIWAEDRTSAVKNPEMLRISDKCCDPVAAAKSCWGMAATNMWVKPLGGRVLAYRSGKEKAVILDPTSEGWVQLTAERGDVLRSAKERK